MSKGDAEGNETLQPIPQAPFRHLQTLWFQLTGTLCNLECVHCFIACGPTNHRLKFLEPETVYRYLDEAVQLGVREIYFTGGEPFLHKQILPILDRALQIAPTTVLTNGTLITTVVAEALGALQAKSRYSLEVRVSLDDVDEARNDAVRGRGALQKALRALHLLQDHGIVPIIAVTEYLYDTHSGASEPGEGRGFYRKFRDFLISNGIAKPRLKVIPVFAIGQLDGTVPLPTYVTTEMMQGFDASALQCTSSRIVAEEGVYACPILVGEAKALLSPDTLTASQQPCSLYHTACHTCYVTGMTCANH